MPDFVIFCLNTIHYILKIIHINNKFKIYIIINWGDAFMFKPKKVSSEEILKGVALMLDEIINDTTVPRNIRAAAQNAKDSVLDENEEFIVRSATAIQYLDDISDDPNMPLHTRTQIWSIVSELETVKNE